MITYKEYRKDKQLSMEEIEYYSEHIKNRESQEKLFETFIPCVIKTANQLYVDHKAIVEFDDVVSEGMMGLWQAIRSFDPSKGYLIATLIQRCVRNGIVNFIKRNRKFIETSSLDEPIRNYPPDVTLYDLIEDTDFDIDSYLGSKEIVGLFSNVLSERDVRIAEDFFVRGFKYKDIARKYNITTTYVGVIIKRTRKRMIKNYGII